MSEVHIFGLDHFHQNLETSCTTPAGIADELQQKAGLTDALSEIVLTNGVELIAEEGKLDRPCAGHKIARAKPRGRACVDVSLRRRCHTRRRSVFECANPLPGELPSAPPSTLVERSRASLPTLAQEAPASCHHIRKNRGGIPRRILACAPPRGGIVYNAVSWECAR
jgi:hypothetical protein